MGTNLISAVMTLGSAAALGLVMCLHVPTLPKYWLFDLGVPWFFFASGFWFAASGKGFGEKVRERVGTLLVPYFLWNLVWFPILFSCNWIGWRYSGALRVVDASWPCVLRCLGLSPFAWPALVPTWFLRALFVAAAVVGGTSMSLDCLFLGRQSNSRTIANRTILVLFFWAIYWTRGWWCPAGALWDGFFSFGLPLAGCAWFATGMAVSGIVTRHAPQAPQIPQTAQAPILRIRRQLMPVYILHAAVIVAVGWAAKAFGLFGHLATVAGDVVMWFVGIAGSVAIGEALRRWMPKAARVLFGGR